MVELGFTTQACLSPGTSLLSILLYLQILGIQGRKRVADIQELGPTPLLPGFLIVKYTYGPHLVSIVPLYIWKMTCRDNMFKLGEKIRSQISPLPFLACRLARLLILRMSFTLQNICCLPVLLGRQEKLAKVVWTYSLSRNININ